MKLRLGSEEEAPFANTAEAKGLSGKAASTLESRMKLEMEVLKSSDTLRQVVIKTGLQKLEAGGEGQLSVERAVQRLGQDLKIERVEQSNMVDVSYSGLTSELATATLEEVAAVYPKARLRVYGGPGNYKFLHRQSGVWRQQLDDAENDLVHFRRRYSEFVLPEEREALGRRAVEAQAAFEQADAQVAQYRRKVAEARAKLRGMNRGTAEHNRAALKSEPVGRVVMTLMEMIDRRADLDRHGSTDGQLTRETDDRVRSAKVALNRTLLQASTSQAAADKTADLNPVHQSAEMTLVASETELAGLEGLRNHLKQTSDGYREQMFRLADAAVRDTALVRQVKRTEEQYLLYTKWQEQAIAAEGVAKESILNFSVVQRPTIALEPSTPHVGIDLGLSLLLSVCCGLATVLCADYLSPTALRRYAAVRTITAEAETA